jgi:phosphatidylglycerol:prolipoprotein diacylglycerol transferase
MYQISFPGLGLNFNIDPVAFSIGNFSIAWYGIIIAAGLILALIYGMKRAKEFNITVDDLCDAVIFSIIFGVIGARLYYVLFYVDAFGNNPYFSNPLSIFDIRSGGLGIYGGVIAAFITGFIVCRIKKISAGAMFDIASLGFLIGQAVGRWGNFVNQEAFGSATNLPWRMVVSTSIDPVHPCFLYESLWCLIGFIILHIYSKRRKFNGEIFLMYIAWYAFGRFFIESLRSDSLMIGKLKISMVVAAMLFIAAVITLVYKYTTLKKVKEQQAAEYDPLFEDASRAVEAEMEDDSDSDEYEEDEESDNSESEEADESDNTENEDNSSENIDDNDSENNENTGDEN